MKVELYTATACPHCPEMKARLNEAKIEYTEKNTDVDNVRFELYGLGRCTTPSIVLTDDNGIKHPLFTKEEEDEFIKNASKD